MRGIVTFHPIDLSFFDDLVGPLIAGEKVNPEAWLASALRLRIANWQAQRYVEVLEDLLAQIEPPPLPTEGKLLDRIKARLERFDFRIPRGTAIAHKALEPDLHLSGRPFLITENSADRVSTIVDEFRQATDARQVDDLILEQLIRLHPELPRHVELEHDDGPRGDQAFRTQLLNSLKSLFDMATAARADQDWRSGGRSRPAREAICDELPWRALTLHSRAVPYWMAQDVDGLASVCEAAGLPAPDVLSPATRPFFSALDAFPELLEAFDVELKGEQRLGAFVSADDVPELLAFLNDVGTRIIKVASEHGEGQACSLLLRKIRECLRYAEMHGMGYLEAGGLPVLEDGRGSAS